MIFMIFNVRFVFCDFSAFKMPGEMVLYIFQQPSLGRIQKEEYFYPRIKNDESIDKTGA